jgi:CelD/BcsL family acetyltransferase involved in cellulose biosynthesis
MIGRVTDREAIPEAVEAMARLSREAWGDEDAYFGEPRFEAFLVDAFRAVLGAGHLDLLLARDSTGIHGVLASVWSPERTVALLIGTTRDPAYKGFSLGKNLFERSIGLALERGSRLYDFLWVGEYKQRFWHAEPQPIETALVGRGVRGRLAAALVGLQARRRRADGS